MRRALLASSLALVLAFTVAACGDDDGATPDDGDGPELPDDLPDDVLDDPDGALDDAARDLEELQEAEGGGSATLVIGEESWEFDSVLCAFGPDETGQEDMTFAMVSTTDGLQLNAQVTGAFGDSITFLDVENFQDPSVSYSASTTFNAIADGPESFIEIDGTNVTASTPFSDETAGPEAALDQIDGTLTVTCP